MGADLAESRRGRSVEKQKQDDMPMRERWNGEYDDFGKNESDEVQESGKHHSKDKSKSSGQREEKEHRSRDRDRSKALDGVKEREKENKDSEKDRSSSRDRRKEDREEREKDKVREKDNDHEKHREKEKDKERRDRLKEKEREREREKELEKEDERGRDKERGKEKSRDKDKDREKERDRAKDREREKYKDRERERENGKHRGKDTADRERVKDRSREKDKQADQEKDRTRDRERSSRKQKDDSHDMAKDIEKERVDNSDDEYDSNILKQQEKDVIAGAGYHQSASELEERISKMREERLIKPSEGASEVLSWVNRSRKLEEKRSVEKEKALQRSKVFEEQDNMIDEESDDEPATQHTKQHLGGVKILHGLDKVLEGGAVVLTLKDQSILADGDINQEVDMLENVEIGEQKRRDDAYKAAKKKTGVYDDKFNDEPGAEKKILPQYDDPVADEGVTLDSSGRFTGEAERKLEELRKRINGVSASTRGEDLNSTGKISTDYYTQEEMTKFKKPKKKKSLRKKDKLDLDALEAEAKSAGLGSEDLGSRNDGRRQNLREEQDRIEAEMRSNAYQSAYAKADEASKALRQEQVRSMQIEEDDTPVFGDDDDELRKSLERARKVALKKQEEEKSGPQVITLIASSPANDSTKDNPNLGSGDQPENKVVFTEMEEFVWGLQLDEEEKNPESEDVFMEEDVAPSSTSDQEMRDEDSGWTDVKETMKDETPAKEEEKEVVPDETIHESAVGKGLAGALKLLKDREHSRKPSNGVLTPKEAFRLLSHKFHGKGPGKMKQEKRMRQYHEELKVKQMKNADTPSLSVERMREAQAKLQTPYLVLSGHVKPGQSSDPRSGFATVEKDLAGGLTPMLGDKKVEHFLNIKRKSEHGDAASQKKPKT
ncbi:hypothetical protein DH2020_018382 [Rehmannia glutinosa]|uniref:SART-1 family protein n=1 Tax=Rehmannia glutinosa TaxID=99300 RepID=A0ABR0WJX2_REHGL